MALSHFQLGDWKLRNVSSHKPYFGSSSAQRERGGYDITDNSRRERWIVTHRVLLLKILGEVLKKGSRY